MKRYLLTLGALGLAAFMQRSAPSMGPPQPLEFWGDAAPDQVRLYPQPTPVTRVARAAEIPRVKMASGGGGTAESEAPPQSNSAVRLAVTGVSEERELFGAVADPGATFVVLATLWENIHPKEKISKARLEGKSDRTMGVGGLTSGGRDAKEGEYVEMDVAYKIPRLADNLYLLADGFAIPLHAAGADLPGGADPDSDFVVAKQGERRELQLVFLAPEGAENLALQLLDYANGHVLIPVRGDVKRARGEGGPVGDVLAKGSTEMLELAALGLRWSDEYRGEPAAAGWRFAVVTLGGRSLSSGGGVANIVQFDPTKYAWVTTDGGYLYYAAGGSTDAQGVIRFTPDVYQQQEIAFLVPEATERVAFGLRVMREVLTLPLTKSSPKKMPSPRSRYRDGDVVEVLYFGSRRDGELLILDLGVRPLAEGKGIELSVPQQFELETPGGRVRPDAAASAKLRGRPSSKLVVPPGTPVRFELAFRTDASPDGLAFRGFRSQGRLKL
jgi:hypothetical protein